MKSRAHIKSHPLHPILVAFPIAFFIGAFLFDVLAQFLNKDALWQTGNYLAIAGIAGALLAAIPGIIDYFYAVPPESSAKKRATQHGLINVLNVCVFCFATYYRTRNDANEFIVLGAEGLGIILLSIAGWMGGTLVYRNQIGVDHRYANAGKWNEAHIERVRGRIEVATANELKMDALKLLHIDGKRIALGRTEKGYVAFQDRCTHRGGPLSDGVLICGTVQCPWHGSQFDVNTGTVKAGPATEEIETYKVEEENGKVFLIL
jgi:uncharacterized membrane protein/nitrite reductase/ring-hydroxylating ferredoxin subunit